MYSKLTDRESEAQLLLLFIPMADQSGDASHMLQHWRRGKCRCDCPGLSRLFRRLSDPGPTVGGFQE